MVRLRRTHRLGGVRRLVGHDEQTDIAIFRIRTSQLRCLALRGVRPPASHWSRPSASIWRASPAVYALRARFRGLRPRPTSEVKTEVTFLFQLFAGNNFAFIGRGANAPPKARKSRSKSFFGLLTALAAFGRRQKSFWTIDTTWQYFDILWSGFAGRTVSEEFDD